MSKTHFLECTHAAIHPCGHDVRSFPPGCCTVVRQEFYRLHHLALDVQIKRGQWNISDMRGSTFCLCPSGVGFGWRVYIALVAGCIPVIIQPGVEQAFGNMVPYHKFSITLPLKAVRELPHILRAVPETHRCALRSNAMKYSKLFMWQHGGFAYDMLMLSLCRRALQIFKRIHGQSLDSQRIQKLPWTRCALMTAEQLLNIANSAAVAV